MSAFSPSSEGLFALPLAIPTRLAAAVAPHNILRTTSDHLRQIFFVCGVENILTLAGTRLTECEAARYPVARRL